MARKRPGYTAKSVVEDKDMVEAVEEPAVENNSVKVIAVFNRMRNPYTGAVFNKANPTDVIDLQSKDNYWTRRQIEEKVLKIYK